MFFTQSCFKNTLHLLHVRDIEIQMMQQSRKNHQKTNQANNISIIQIIHSVLNKKVLEQNMLKWPVMMMANFFSHRIWVWFNFHIPFKGRASQTLDLPIRTIFQLLGILHLVFCNCIDSQVSWQRLTCMYKVYWQGPNYCNEGSRLSQYLPLMYLCSK